MTATAAPAPHDTVDDPEPDSVKDRTATATMPSSARPSGLANGPDEQGSARAYALLLAGYPVAWALGFGPFIWLAIPLIMAFGLLRDRPVAVPRGGVLYGLFLILVAGSAIQIGSAGRAALYVLRSGWYAAAFVCLLYIVAQRSPRARANVLTGMVMLWILTVLGGYLAIVSPELTWSTPVAKLLPGVIANDEFVQELITPKAAEIQIFRFDGVTLNRPAAPYPYTNGWGSTVALLTPMVFGAIRSRATRIPPAVLYIMLPIGVVPFYVALNRGSWLTLGVGLLYGVVRQAMVKRSFLPIKLLAAAAVVGLVAVTSTGVLDTALERLETRSADSNETRASIYVETLTAAAESPMIGYGGPRRNPANPSGPPLGTHGQLWAVLYAHGFVAAGLYVLFFIGALFRYRPTDPIGHWTKVSLVIGLLQLPIYGHLPQQLFIMMGLVGLLTLGSTQPPGGKAQLSQS